MEVMSLNADREQRCSTRKLLVGLSMISVRTCTRIATSSPTILFQEYIDATKEILPGLLNIERRYHESLCPSLQDICAWK